MHILSKCLTKPSAHINSHTNTGFSAILQTHEYALNNTLFLFCYSLKLSKPAIIKKVGVIHILGGAFAKNMH
jgi:hypothetical protein